MLFTGMASPLTGAPGAALLYLAIGVLVWPRTAAAAAIGVGRRRGAARGVGRQGDLGHRVVRAWGSCGCCRPTEPAARISGAISNAVTGEPGWLAHIQLSVAHGIGSGGGSVAVVCGVLSFVIGLGPLVSRHTTVFLVAGAALALDYWVFGEAFGRMFTGLGTDPNTGPLLILLALTVYPNLPPVARDVGSVQPERGGGNAIGFVSFPAAE